MNMRPLIGAVMRLDAKELKASSNSIKVSRQKALMGHGFLVFELLFEVSVQEI
jgi:hypothetical protein